MVRVFNEIWAFQSKSLFAETLPEPSGAMIILCLMRKIRNAVLLGIIFLVISECAPVKRPLRVAYPRQSAAELLKEIVPKIAGKRFFGHFFSHRYGLEGDFVILSDTDAVKIIPMGPLFNKPIELKRNQIGEFGFLMEGDASLPVDSAFFEPDRDRVSVFSHIGGVKVKAVFENDVPHTASISDSVRVELSSFRKAGTDDYYPGKLRIVTPTWGVIDARIDSVVTVSR